MIPKDRHQPELVLSAVKEMLNNLQLEYIDLLLVNWLYADDSTLKSDGYSIKGLGLVPIMDTWKAMEALVVSGKVRAIGVSNFSRIILEMMIPRCRIVPAVNQTEVHPHNPEHKLVNYCQSKGITVIGHSPLGGNCVRVMDDKLIKDIAKSHGCTPAQVIISWLWVRGIAVIPRSNNKSRLKKNLCTVPLTLDEMQVIGKIEKRERRFDSKCSIEELEQIFYGQEIKHPSV
ncbi:Aldo/keto reductase [Coemansia reversa NRRL 1564]|uniref:Aldo/keto reductase n=1 Tax=Coemansia reversa (strain ATCC 12441 / NRRL 1564) TaxID=763665 RepID=A0A2G5BK80_COERN|nr:Aldo/keto reductase [Coemansia reversa NRRL 1564]|eukprot:PIA19147.1 Aldo/keto reductase [Coemansia reversa NRRL 1564]